ncbi:MAG: hypothetical protein R3A48_00560 [Polyangiales bacterium]
MRARRVSSLLGLSLMFIVRAPSAADLRGTLAGAAELTPAPTPPDARRRDFYWEVPNGVVPLSTPRADIERDIAVVLTGAGVEESRQPGAVVLEGGRCRPGTVVVSPGAMVNVENADLLTHELYVVARGSAERVVLCRSHPRPGRGGRSAWRARASTRSATRATPRCGAGWRSDRGRAGCSASTRRAPSAPPGSATGTTP